VNASAGDSSAEGAELSPVLPDRRREGWRRHRIVVNAALMRLCSVRHRSERSVDDLLPRFTQETFAQAPGRRAYFPVFTNLMQSP